MDPNRFDALTRSLGAARSRRGLLKTLGAAALGAVGLGRVPRVAAKPAGKVTICHWDADQGSYEELSVSVNAVPAHERHGDVINPDFENDANNCGGCGIVCATEVDGATATCSGGECKTNCTSGTPCGELCADTDSDPNNCGSCGNVCPGPTSGSGTAICTNGTCDISCGSVQGFRLTLCDGACVHTGLPDNCGGCGNVCPDSCQCLLSYNGIFCYSGRTGNRGGCTSDTDCTVAGETCQDIDNGLGTCMPIVCTGDATVCPTGSQCTADRTCDELCPAA